MNYEELLEFLGIDNGSEFEYFENLSDLLESEEEIQDDALYLLFRQANKENLIDLIDNYFEDLLKSIPDDSADIFTLVEGVKMSFIGLIEASDSDKAEDETALVHFCEEIGNFRNWYCVESKAECVNMTKNLRETVSLRDALVYARLEKIDGDKYQFDFEGCMGYAPEEYVMSYGDLARAMRDEQAESDYDGDDFQYEGYDPDMERFKEAFGKTYDEYDEEFSQEHNHDHCGCGCNHHH